VVGLLHAYLLLSKCVPDLFYGSSLMWRGVAIVLGLSDSLLWCYGGRRSWGSLHGQTQHTSSVVTCSLGCFGRGGEIVGGGVKNLAYAIICACVREGGREGVSGLDVRLLCVSKGLVDILSCSFVSNQGCGTYVCVCM